VKTATIEELKSFLQALDSEYELYVPVTLPDGTRSLDALDKGELSLLGGKIPRKTTSVFFPQSEKMFTIKQSCCCGSQAVSPSQPTKPIFVVGLTAEDAECLQFIDKFFSTNFCDDIYFAKRNNSVVAVISGKCGKDGEFLKIAGDICDLEFVYDGDKFVVIPYSEVGKKIEGKLKSSKAIDSIDQLKKESDNLPKDDLNILNKASDIIMQGKVPADFWSEIGDKCIACTSCNYACPTCTCFDTIDREINGEIERCRIWDSCQLDGFMREASGHNPLGDQGNRTWRRIHHKLNADRERWGYITCYLCGRCDDVCPTGIGIKVVSKEIVQRFS